METPEEPNKAAWPAALGTDEFSWQQAMGGWRGVAESLLPGLVFVIVFVLSGNLWWTLGLSAGLAILFAGIRLAQRQPLTQAAAGLLGVLIGVVWAAASGRAENYFAWGLLTNAFYAAALLISVLIRQPAGAWALTFLWGLPKGWMREAASRGLYRRSVAVTWVWFAVFAARLAVQLPLYYAGAVASLGTLKLLMGLPLFGLAAWFTWALLRNQKPNLEPIPAAEEAREASSEEN